MCATWRQAMEWVGRGRLIVCTSLEYLLLDVSTSTATQLFTLPVPLLYPGPLLSTAAERSAFQKCIEVLRTLPSFRKGPTEYVCKQERHAAVHDSNRAHYQAKLNVRHRGGFPGSFNATNFHPEAAGEPRTWCAHDGEPPPPPPPPLRARAPCAHPPCAAHMLYAFALPIQAAVLLHVW